MYPTSKTSKLPHHNGNVIESIGSEAEFYTKSQRNCNFKRFGAAAALRWSSILPTPHSLLTSHDGQDEHSWTKTAHNRTVQFAGRRHGVSTLQREGEHLVVEKIIMEMVRPVLELLYLSWALGRDSNNSFSNPDILATQVLF